jgi:hypothetical protein
MPPIEFFIRYKQKIRVLNSKSISVNFAKRRHKIFVFSGDFFGTVKFCHQYDLRRKPMIIKSIITSAVLGVAIPVFAMGLVSGVALARTETKKPGCNRCCILCNGRCKNADHQRYGNEDREAVK